MKIPVAVYRVQFHSEFTFTDCGKIIPYLRDLGITALYASPIFQAQKGSRHGYDVIDPGKLNGEIGTRGEFESLAALVKKHGMGWIQDIVPNHMCYDPSNPFIADIIENGPASKYYRYFDIDWDSGGSGLRHKVLNPVLGDYYYNTLKSGKLKIRYSRNGFSVEYYEQSWPLAVDSYSEILFLHSDALKRDVNANRSGFDRLLSVREGIESLKKAGDTDRKAKVKDIKENLWRLYSRHPEIKNFIDGNLAFINKTDENPESLEPLHAVLRRQYFALSYWKRANKEINYRRFFSINSLIGVRVEDDSVFAESHALIEELARQKKITGLRVDHIDGLRDPAAYLEKLRKMFAPAYIVVEKILAHGETPEEQWPVEGTTGYDFILYASGIFCQKDHEKEFDDLYNGFTGENRDKDEILFAQKEKIISGHFLGEIDKLCAGVKRLLAMLEYKSDIALPDLRRALVMLLVHFPVYRTYLTGRYGSDFDKKIINEVIGRCKELQPERSMEFVYDALREILLFIHYERFPKNIREKWDECVVEFQQLSGPVTAKSFEDTYFYVYNRLAALNEVGNDPRLFGIGTDEFHGYNLYKSKRYPLSLNTLSTHDTKRGEDARARLFVLSELPGEWEKNINNWNQQNDRCKKRIEGVRAPVKNDEYFLYQTLIGSLPFSQKMDRAFLKRIEAYIVKAAREAKQHTSWRNPDSEYENAYLDFFYAVFNGSNKGFLDSFLDFQKKIAFYGLLNSLAQSLLKMTAPGIPDFYQGCELWNFDLVDPDNRREVDFGKRMDLLKDLRKKADANGRLQELLQPGNEDRLKLFLTATTLSFRKKLGALFQTGSYLPLKTEGAHKDHVVAYARRDHHDTLIAVVPRFLTKIVDPGDYPFGETVWKDTSVSLPKNIPELFTNLYSGKNHKINSRIEVAEILTHFPVALLLNA